MQAVWSLKYDYNDLFLLGSVSGFLKWSFVLHEQLLLEQYASCRGTIHDSTPAPVFLASPPPLILPSAIILNLYDWQRWDIYFFYKIYWSKSIAKRGPSIVSGSDTALQGRKRLPIQLFGRWRGWKRRNTLGNFEHSVLRVSYFGHPEG